MAEEYLPFEGALGALQMPEAELRALVAQGKLRAFRDGNMLKFRRSDIEALRTQHDAERTLVIQPGPDADTAVPQVVTPPAVESSDFLSDEPFEFDDTAETLVGGTHLSGSGTGDVELSLEPSAPAAPHEPSTKVPTIELTPPDTGTDDTQVPTLDLGEAVDTGSATGDTEVPTMVLGLDQYDDTQSATEDVATEEVSLEPGELGSDTEEATAPFEGLQPQDDLDGLRPGTGGVPGTGQIGTGRVTPASAFGTGEALFVREQPSALYTVMNAMAAFVLVVPGALFFYCVASSKVPDWEFLKSIIGFFWDLIGDKPIVP
ncbi:MAG TPA: helix-turn-helix domain-containing protein [Planctomycetota bacterium]|nr:helix-turn-helix domain-containing protein [Planctomycetota bacterium]